MTAAILAGGLGTRLRPLTETIPKALVEIKGTPFVAHQLNLLRSRGIPRVVLCIGHLGEMIQDSILRRPFFGSPQEFVRHSLLLGFLRSGIIGGRVSMEANSDSSSMFRPFKGVRNRATLNGI